ncbi:MAG: hypothetical protein SO161_02390 [Treponema sp.]|nr:hypothetical protein [Treponema sp.]
MAKKNDTRFFENRLLDFVAATDPLLEMLQWMMDKFMEIEVARKTGAPKGSHSQSRTGYRCGYRVRRYCQMLWIEVWIGKGLSDFLQHSFSNFMSLATRSSFSKPFNRRHLFSACRQSLKAMASVAFAVPLSMFRPSVSFWQMVAEFY